jgi:hypothetical protein
MLLVCHIQVLDHQAAIELRRERPVHNTAHVRTDHSGNVVPAALRSDVRYVSAPDFIRSKNFEASIQYIRGIWTLNSCFLVSV